MPRRATRGQGGRARCAGTRAETLLCLAHLLLRCEDCSSLSGCLLKEWMQFSIWKEEGLGSARSSSAAHIRIWGNKLKALPSLGAPVCCQVRAGDPPQCLPTKDVSQSQVGSSSTSKGMAPPCPPGLTRGKVSQTGIHSCKSLLGEMRSASGTSPAPQP